jgi:hypothetical protein
MEPGRKNSMAEHKSVKNSWMENEALVAAAVKAVKADRSLRWINEETTWEDYQRAAGWVSRERKRREWGFDLSKLRPFSEATLKTASKAAIALRDADLGIEPPKPVIQNNVATTPTEYTNTKPFEDRAISWLNGVAFQFVGLLLMIPLMILFGSHYGGGLIATVVMPIALGVGIVILVFRFIRATASTVKSGKPIKKNWYE